MAKQVVLLRGINLGSKRRVGMAALRDLLAEAGYEDVRTHLQSGNVVLSSRLSAAKLKAELERVLAKGLGMDVEVFVRSRAELAKVVEGDPFGKVADNPSRYQVTVLSAKLPAAVKKELEAAEVAPERVAVRGKEIYAWHPGGFARSPLAKLLSERSLGVSATARNWATVAKLLELASE